MRQLISLAVLAACAFLMPSAGHAGEAESQPTQQKPNVVFIILDDLNDYVGFLGGHPQTVTPNMDALAARSTSFTDAYPTLPICAPSRASLFSGIQPYRSGSMSFGQWFRNPVLKNSRTMMEYFRLNGYRTMGAGKVLHHNTGYIWDEFYKKADYGPVWIENGVEKAHPSVPRPFADVGKIDGSFAPMTAEGVIDVEGRPYTGWWSTPHKQKVRFASDGDRDLLPDEDSVQWAARRLGQMAESGEDQPFFMAIGIIKPHTPLHVPQEYFDRIPGRSEIVIPNYDPGDVDDTHYRDVFDKETRGRLLFDRLQASYPTVEQGLQTFIRAYLAATAFADDQVGTLIRAVEGSPFADNTIIVLTSDHGWTNGEKDVLFKNNLWQSGARVPLLIYLPGHQPQVLDAPVSHIDLYPTLAELAGLEGDTRKNRYGRKIDGASLVGYIEGAKGAEPDHTVVMLKASNPRGAGSQRVSDQHYSLITREWRYIRYNDGQEELYNRSADPLERRNLADEERFSNVAARLGARLNRKLAQD